MHEHEKDKLLSFSKTSLSTLDKIKEYPQIILSHIHAMQTKEYTLCELNAGCGYNVIKHNNGTVEEILGTPLQAMRLFEHHPELSTEIIAIEYDLDAAETLKVRAINIAKDKSYPLHIKRGDNSADYVLNDISAKYSKGLVVSDPYGAPSSKTVKLYRDKFPEFDLLVRVNFNQCCRNLGAYRAGASIAEAYPLTDMIVEKQYYRHWMISDPRDKLKWCWLFGTNDSEVFNKMLSDTDLLSNRFEDRIELFNPITIDEDRYVHVKWDDLSLRRTLNYKPYIFIPKRFMTPEAATQWQKIQDEEKRIAELKQKFLTEQTAGFKEQVINMTMELDKMVTCIQQSDPTYRPPVSTWNAKLTGKGCGKGKGNRVDTAIKDFLLKEAVVKTKEDIYTAFPAVPKARIDHFLNTRVSGKRKMYEARGNGFTAIVTR
jgi:hypothetical protein